jgi:hypothetical protein
MERDNLRYFFFKFKSLASLPNVQDTRCVWKRQRALVMDAANNTSSDRVPIKNPRFRNCDSRLPSESQHISIIVRLLVGSVVTAVESYVG